MASDLEASSRAEWLTLLRQTSRVRALYSTIRNSRCITEQFVLNSNLIVHILLEEALGLLPEVDIDVQTPCGQFNGCQTPSVEQLCAISIMRAADCMLGVLRDIFPGIAAGKILIQRDEATATPQLLYSKLPSQLSHRHVLLLDPMLATGGSCIAAIKVLIEHGATEEKIIFISVLSCNDGLNAVHAAYPRVRIVTGAVDPILNEKKYIVPGLGDFGDRYFGTG